MKIQFVNQLDMQWVDGFRKAFEDHECRWSRNPNLTEEDGTLNVPDVRVFMWLYPEVVEAINKTVLPVKNVVYIRRFEYYTNLIEHVDWSKVGAVIMVNDFLADGFKKRTGITPHVVYNAVDPDKWTFKERGPGPNIAWVGFVNQKKNLPLALQIMNELPRHCVLHVAGDFQDAQSMDYAVHMANQMGVKVNFYGHVKSEYMDAWLEDKNYLLNTSISEGCPNSVLEAMAKGIKPVVHAWPGSEYQFQPFLDIKDACRDILSREYSSLAYEKAVKDRFGPSNYTKVRQIIEEVANGI